MATIRFDPVANRAQSEGAAAWAEGKPKRKRKPIDTRRRRVKRLPRQRQPDAQRLGYYRELRAITQQMQELVRRHIVPRLSDWLAQATTDSAHLDAKDREGEARAAVRALGRQFVRSLNTAGKLEPMVRKYARATADFQWGELTKQIRAGTLSPEIEGLIVGLRRGIGIGPEASEPWLTSSINKFTSENVGLIVTIPERYFEELESVVGGGVRAGVRADVLMKRIQERAEVSDSNARRIANDQIGKYFGQLNETRQTELGIDAYIWRTASDGRVRDAHQNREGKRYLWAEPPGDELDPARGGHPGQAINCRCFSEPDLGALVEGLTF